MKKFIYRNKGLMCIMILFRQGLQKERTIM